MCVHLERRIEKTERMREEIKTDRYVTTDTNRRTQNMTSGVGTWCMTSKKKPKQACEVLTTLHSYLLPCQYSTTAHPGLLVCPSSPSRCSPSEGVKGWQVPGGAARSLRVRFLRGQAVLVFRVRHKRGETQDGLCPEQETDRTTAQQQSHLITLIWGQWQTATPVWGGCNQLSAYYPTDHSKSIILDLLL